MIIEVVELEFGVGHRLVGMESPDVAGIDEDGPIDDVVDGEPQFGVELQLQVAGFFDVVGNGDVATRADGAVEPTAQSVGAAAVEAALEGQVLRVAIGHADADELAHDEPRLGT